MLVLTPTARYTVEESDVLSSAPVVDTATADYWSEQMADHMAAAVEIVETVEARILPTLAMPRPMLRSDLAIRPLPVPDLDHMAGMRAYADAWGDAR